MSRSLSPPRQPHTCRLGILGTRNQVTSAEITALLDLIVADSGQLQAAYLPQEGMSSIYAESYLDAADVPVTALDASWHRHGRSAVARRDAEIVRSSTHFLVFGGPRSQRPLNVATELARKGRTVYYLPHGSLELELLEVTCPVLTGPYHSGAKPHADAPLTCPGQVGRGHKVSKGKGSSRQPTLEEVYS
jgi:hypothetical protein